MFFTIICATLGISATSVLIYKLYPKCKSAKLSDIGNENKISSKSRNHKINSKSSQHSDVNQYFSLISPDFEDQSEDDELETKYLTKYQLEEKIMCLNNESSSIICVE